jgi:hypothetical protein
MRCVCVCQRYTNGGRRGSFLSETGEKKELNYVFFRKKCRFFVKGRKEEHRTTLVKRDESERKEEEEREREFMAISR